MATTKTPAGRAKPPAEPAKPKASPAPATRLPLDGGPTARPTQAAECLPILLEVNDKAARIVLVPAPGVVAAILDETFGPFGWACRRYNCGGTLYCGVGVYVPAIGQVLHKDAPALDDYGGGGKASAASLSSLYGAAALWGVCADIKALPIITLDADQVDIIPVAGRDGKAIAGYKLAQKPTVDDFGRDENGRIVLVQFADRTGKKIVWQRS